MALTANVADELQARKAKETNLVVIGLPESPEPDDEDTHKTEVLNLF